MEETNCARLKIAEKRSDELAARLAKARKTREAAP